MIVRVPITKTNIGGSLVALLAISIILGGGIVLSAESQSGTVPLNLTVEQTFSVSLSTQLTDGIFFGTVNPNTNHNYAINNTNCEDLDGTCYNWTIDSSSTSGGAFYNKLNAAVTCTGGTCDFEVQGSSTLWNESFSTNQTFTATAYTGIGNCGSVSSGSDCWTRYYVNVSSGVESGTYGLSNTYSWCANATVGSTSC